MRQHAPLDWRDYGPCVRTKVNFLVSVSHQSGVLLLLLWIHAGRFAVGQLTHWDCARTAGRLGAKKARNVLS